MSLVSSETELIRHLKVVHTQLVDIRRHLHAEPEHGYHEHDTARLLAECLQRYGVDEVHTGIGGTGVVAVINGGLGDNGHLIGLRAELDCLVLQELSDTRWASKRPGFMHACGHDGHMAILLGAVSYLARYRNFAGKVCAIFQPAEEGGAGAKAMIEDGLLQRFPLSAVYAIHNAPWIPFGQVVANSGPMMAAADRFKITVSGPGGHGGIPHQGVDAIVAAAHVILAVQSIVARNIDPADAAVVSFGAIEAGRMKQHSVMPASVEMVGTVRTYSPDVQDRIEELLNRIVPNTCAAFGATGTVEFLRWYPATINHAREAAIALEAAAELFGPQNALCGIKPSTASEDFAYMLQRVPGAYIWVGQGRDGGISLHSPYYDFDDRLITPAAALLARVAERELAP